ncbi:MAG: CAP domain-containing protein [Alphaproteobacteria bacterium]
MPTARHNRPTMARAFAPLFFLAVAFGGTILSAHADPALPNAAYARINALRAGHGLGPVTPDRRLIAAASRHAHDMAGNDFMGHVGSDGSRTGSRADAAGYGWRLIAENVAAGPDDALVVISLWMRSPGHRNNLLTRGAVHAGFVHVARDGASYRNYWVLVLAAPL